MKRFTKKIAFVMALVMVFALTSAVSANAADLYSAKYTFNSACVSEGWTNAYSQVYDDATGYGFDAANGWTAGIITETASTKVEGSPMIGLKCDDAALVDAISKAVSEFKGDTEVNFYVKLPAGTYDITVYAGAISQNNTYDFNRIFINGEQVVRDFEADPWNADAKSSKATLLSIEDVQWTKTITLTEETKVEIKASNPTVENVKWFGTDYATGGGRAYMNAVVINEVAPVVEEPVAPAVPKDGECCSRFKEEKRRLIKLIQKAVG